MDFAQFTETTFYVDYIQGNQMLVALVGATLIGTVLYLLKGVPKLIWDIFRKQFTAHMYIDNSSVSYEVLLSFLTKGGYVKNVRRLAYDSTITYRSNQDVSPFTQRDRFVRGPTLGIGPFIIFYRGRPILIHHEVKEAKTMSIPKVLNIYSFGRSNKLIKRLVDEATAEWFEGKSDKMDVFTFTGSNWEILRTKSKRPIDTIVLPEKQKTGVLNDIDWFIHNKQWYINKGIPYRRNYLFEGPPGTGKSSLVYALGSHFDLNVHVLSPNSIMNDEALFRAININPGSILLIEDIDKCGLEVSQRKSTGKMDNSPAKQDEGEEQAEEVFRGVTMSGILNALDGITAPEDVIICMTTNYPENIDDAIFRSGRVDYSLHVGYPDKETIKTMFWRFYGEHAEASSGMAERFASLCLDRGCSPAKIQEICMIHNQSPKSVIDYLETVESL